MLLAFNFLLLSTILKINLIRLAFKASRNLTISYLLKQLNNISIKKDSQIKEVGAIYFSSVMLVQAQNIKAREDYFRYQNLCLVSHQLKNILDLQK